MTAPANAAANGSTTTAGQPVRITGYAKIRQAEAYHASSVMSDALFEASELATAIHRAVSEAYFRRDGEEGPTTAEIAESPQIRDKSIEALRCLRIAEDYLYRLAPDQPAPEPF
ncbi:MAG: hypothetical protein ACRDPY_07940 [Streptosporangiaceae bacterium]